METLIEDRVCECSRGACRIVLYESRARGKVRKELCHARGVTANTHTGRQDHRPRRHPEALAPALQSPRQRGARLSTVGKGRPAPSQRGDDADSNGTSDSDSQADSQADSDSEAGGDGNSEAGGRGNSSGSAESRGDAGLRPSCTSCTWRSYRRDARAVDRSRIPDVRHRPERRHRRRRAAAGAFAAGHGGRLGAGAARLTPARTPRQRWP